MRKIFYSMSKGNRMETTIQQGNYSPEEYGIILVIQRPGIAFYSP
jgi:hypothetical protein